MKIFNQLKSIPKLETPEHLKTKLRGEWDTAPTDRVLYVHYRADDGLPYYVGYGSPDRPTQVRKNQRNDDWHEVYKQHGLRVEVKLTGLHEHVANIVEVWWIYSYRQKFGRYSEGGTMVNKSSGGGCPATGSKRNAEQLENLIALRNQPDVKAKYIAAKKDQWQDENSVFNSEEYKEKKSAAATGKLGEQASNFQGYSVGVNGKQFVIFTGRIEMIDCGFSQGCISSCITGRKNFKSHKGFRWTRQTTLNPQDFAGLEPFNAITVAHLHRAFTERAKSFNRFDVVLP